jgi:RNA polymerase sigma factor for flagellar operon FliA
MHAASVIEIGVESRPICEELIHKHASWVHTLAQRMWARCPAHIELQDLYGAATCGLVEAAQSFDPRRGVTFESFAMPRVRGSMLDALRKMDWTPRSVLRKRRLLVETLARLEARLGRAAEEAEVAAEIGISLEEVRRLLEDVRGVRLESLEAAVQDDGSSVEERIEDKDSILPDELLQNAEAVEALGEAIERLRQQERLVVTLYFYEGLTLKEIGEVLGLTESRVSQVKTAALLRLRPLLQAHR